MKIGPTLFLAVAAWAGAIVPGRADFAGPTVLEKGSYSYQAPKGWVIQTPFIAGQTACFGSVKEGYAATMKGIVLNGPGSTAEVVNAFVKNLKESGSKKLLILSRQPFYTAAGLDGIRLMISYTAPATKLRLVAVHYFLGMDAQRTVLITATCRGVDGQNDVPLFDASMKMLTLE